MRDPNSLSLSSLAASNPYNNDSVISNISLLKEQIMSDYTSSEINTSDINKFLDCATEKLIVIEKKNLKYNIFLKNIIVGFYFIKKEYTLILTYK